MSRQKLNRRKLMLQEKKLKNKRSAATNVLNVLADPESSVATREKALDSSRNNKSFSKILS